MERQVIVAKRKSTQEIINEVNNIPDVEEIKFIAWNSNERFTTAKQLKYELARLQEEEQLFKGVQS